MLTTLHTIKKDVTAKFLVQPEYRCYWACNKTKYNLSKISVYAVHHPIKHQTKPLSFTCITFFVAMLSVAVKWLFTRVHFFNVSQQQAILNDDLLQFPLNIALHKPVQPVLHPFQSQFTLFFLSKQHHD